MPLVLRLVIIGLTSFQLLAPSQDPFSILTNLPFRFYFGNVQTCVNSVISHYAQIILGIYYIISRSFWCKFDEAIRLQYHNPLTNTFTS